MESFAPEYYLVRDGRIDQVKEGEYRQIARLFGSHSLFAARHVKGFIANSPEDKEKSMRFFRKWAIACLAEEGVSDNEDLST